MAGVGADRSCRSDCSASVDRLVNERREVGAETAKRAVASEHFATWVVAKIEIRHSTLRLNLIIHHTNINNRLKYKVVWGGVNEMHDRGPHQGATHTCGRQGKSSRFFDGCS